MFILFLFVFPLAIISAILYRLYKKHPTKKDSWGVTLTTDYKCASIFAGCSSIFFILLTILVTMVSYTSNVDDIQSIKWSYKVEKVADTRYSVLTDIVQKYLIEKYPKLEQDIYKSIGVEKAHKILMYATVYPELKSSKTIADAVNKIQYYYDWSVNLKVYRETKLYNIQVRQKDLWIIPWVIPNYTEE
jgi:hypothetical protein